MASVARVIAGSAEEIARAQWAAWSADNPPPYHIFPQDWMLQADRATLCGAVSDSAVSDLLLHAPTGYPGMWEDVEFCVACLRLYAAAPKSVVSRG